MDLNDPYGAGTKPPPPLPTYAVIPGPDREPSGRTADVPSTAGFPRARE